MSKEAGQGDYPRPVENWSSKYYWGRWKKDRWEQSANESQTERQSISDVVHKVSHLQDFRPSDRIQLLPAVRIQACDLCDVRREDDGHEGLQNVLRLAPALLHQSALTAWTTLIWLAVDVLRSRSTLIGIEAVFLYCTLIISSSKSFFDYERLPYKIMGGGVRGYGGKLSWLRSRREREGGRDGQFF